MEDNFWIDFTLGSIIRIKIYQGIYSYLLENLVEHCYQIKDIKLKYISKYQTILLFFKNEK